MAKLIIDGVEREYDGTDGYVRGDLLVEEANVGLYDRADELGAKLGIPIDSEIEINYQLNNPSKSIYDIEWKKYTDSLGSGTGIVFGGFITGVLLIVEILLIVDLFI